jgi:hypothetical protein
MTTTGRCLCGAIQFEFAGEAVETTHRHWKAVAARPLRPLPPSSPCTIRHCASPADNRTNTPRRRVSVALSVAHAVRRSPIDRNVTPASWTYSPALWLILRTCRRHCTTDEQLPWFEAIDNLPRYAQGAIPRNCRGRGAPRMAVPRVRAGTSTGRIKPAALLASAKAARA